MEGVKHEFSGNIDDNGVLRIKMTEFRYLAKQHPNTQVIVTVEILDGGDVEQMKAWYRNYVLPKVVVAWREFGESYTTEQADLQLRRLTTVCRYRAGAFMREVWELDREMMKRYLDEVTIFCSANLSLSL